MHPPPPTITFFMVIFVSIKSKTEKQGTEKKRSAFLNTLSFFLVSFFMSDERALYCGADNRGENKRKLKQTKY